MNINIFVDINANQLVKKGFRVKLSFSKLAIRGTQMKDISPSASLGKCKQTFNCDNNWGHFIMSWPLSYMLKCFRCILGSKPLYAENKKLSHFIKNCSISIKSCLIHNFFVVAQFHYEILIKTFIFSTIQLWGITLPLSIFQYMIIWKFQSAKWRNKSGM